KMSNQFNPQPIQSSQILSVLKYDILSHLPINLTLKILNYLNLKDIYHCMMVCQSWNKIIDSPINIEAINSSEIEFVKNCPNNFYKRIYRRHFLLKYNWQHGKCQKISFLVPKKYFITSLQVGEERIIPSFGDASINVYDAKTGQLVRKLEGHTGNVWQLQYWNNTLVSGSGDSTIRIWDVEEGCCTHVFYGHTDTIRCLIILIPTENPVTHRIEPCFPIVVSGSRDTTLRVWDLPDVKKDPPYDSDDDDSHNPYFLRLLKGHTAPIGVIAGSGNVLVSGGHDGTVRVWNVSTGNNTFVLRGHRSRVNNVDYSPELQKAVSSSVNCDVRVWSTITGECLFNLNSHSRVVGSLKIFPNYIISGAADSTLRIWSPQTGQCLSVLSGHQGPISCFHHDPKLNIIVSGANVEDTDGIKLWEL
ncbi:hypothetical protein PIROE2DRAFT_23426, partial [Piromyces sp. E2]